jgi:hypothetical protein
MLIVVKRNLSGLLKKFFGVLKSKRRRHSFAEVERRVELALEDAIDRRAMHSGFVGQVDLRQVFLRAFPLEIRDERFGE